MGCVEQRGNAVDLGQFFLKADAAVLVDEAKLAGEVRDFPHPRSIDAVKALAAWRGAASGMTAAEAFQLVRERL